MALKKLCAYTPQKPSRLTLAVIIKEHTMNLDEICYKNTPIKRVILKIDFLNTVKEVNESLPKSLLDVIKKSFPIVEPRQVLGREIQISNTSVTENSTNVKEWLFHTEGRNATLIIKEDYFAIQINNYISFEKVSEVLKEIKNVFFTTFKELVSRRIGLRYINEIDIKEPNPLDWSKYINPSLISNLTATPDQQNIIRSFNNLELKYNDILLKFQYGIINPDYPAIIKKKNYILDLDASFSGMLQQFEIDDYLSKLHEIIQKQFEYSITEELRNYFELKK